MRVLNILQSPETLGYLRLSHFYLLEVIRLWMLPSAAQVFVQKTQFRNLQPILDAVEATPVISNRTSRCWALTLSSFELPDRSGDSFPLCELLHTESLHTQSSGKLFKTSLLHVSELHTFWRT
jgi:hypothetical protein